MPLPRRLYKNVLNRRIEAEARIVDAGEIVAAHERGPLQQLQLVPLDARVRCIPFPLLRNVLERNQVDGLRYVGEFFDCDDFARLLAAQFAARWHVNSVGVVVDASGRHAYNVAFCVDGNDIIPSILEPQADRTVTIGESPHYVARAGFVVL